jgi:hypothetical protein
MNTPTSILWTSAEAAAMTGGVSTQNWCATGVAIALDEIRPGDLYIATQEDNLAAVFRKGAVAAVVSGSHDRHDWPLLMVENVFDALQSLAAAARYKTHAAIISVQGRVARAAVKDILATAGSVHEGGRHLSLGLANLPEDVEFGLFALSPAVRPDIAIVTNCAIANRDTLFETMNSNGCAIINTDDEACISVIARAKAAGIHNILTFGSGENADARLVSILHANNGTRVTVNILGEEMTFFSADREEFNPAALAGLLVLKLAHKTAPSSIHGCAPGTIYKPQGVTLIDPALPPHGPQALFRVTNMIDLGSGRQTAVLDNIKSPAYSPLSLTKKELEIPRKLASLDFVYTSKKVGAVNNAVEILKAKHSSARIESIVPDVLAPGDFLVFRNIRQTSKVIFSEALRLVPEFKGRKIRTSHAV